MSIVQNVNMVVSSFESERWLSEADAFMEYSIGLEGEGRGGAAGNQGDGVDGSMEDYFSPVKGNVAFGSAHDGWAFTVQQFASLYAKKLGCKAEPLSKALWGDFYYSGKTKRILPIKRGEEKNQPLFVSWILEPIWRAYGSLEDGTGHGHRDILTSLCDKLHLGDKVRKAVQHADGRIALRALMRGWLPLSDAVLGMGVRFLPDPRSAAALRIERFLPALAGGRVGGEAGTGGSSASGPGPDATSDAERLKIESAITSCDTSDDAPLVMYVSKMVSVPTTLLPRSSLTSISYDSKDETFLAFGRVFSGQMRPGREVFVIHADGSSVTATIPDVYLMMGRGLESLAVVPAGNILALRGLETAILKSATISSSASCQPFLPLQFQAAPIVQVAVEPAHPGDMDALERGLQLLHRADPLVSVSLEESGEHVVSAAGEIHLETCIKDLKERFARIELVVSPPLVRFKESLSIAARGAGDATHETNSASAGHAGHAAPALPGTSNTSNVGYSQGDPTKIVEAQTAGKGCRLRVKVTPLADQIASEIEGLDDVEFRLRSTSDDLQICFQEGMGAGDAGRIWQLGPKRHGPNMLLASAGTWEREDGEPAVNGSSLRVDDIRDGRDGRDDADGPDDSSGAIGAEVVKLTEVPIPLGSPEVSALIGIAPSNPSLPSTLLNPEVIPELPLADSSGGGTAESVESQVVCDLLLAHDLDPALAETAISAIRSVVSGISTGFQMATASGPLCGEPLRGVLVEIDARLVFATSTTGQGTTTRLLTNEDVFGPFNGQVSAAVRQSIGKAILVNGPRIVEAYFLCEISTSSEGLSAVYAVLGRRRARILREELKEGAGLFVVMAHLPVEASFGFADELRRKSSGSAAASLMFSHWERLDVDPFFQPQTEEEREEFGEEGQGVGKSNLAKKLIDDVLRRKGRLQQKHVADATKQRTRARKV